MQIALYCFLVFLMSAHFIKAYEGQLDRTFGKNGKVVSPFKNNGTWAYSSIRTIALQKDGKIVAIGGLNDWVSEDDKLGFEIARYLCNGTLDSSFNAQGTTPGWVVTDFGSLVFSSLAAAGTIQNDEKIIAVGHVYQANASVTSFATVRYNPDGTLDKSFNSRGLIPGIIITKITGPHTDDKAYAVALQADGKIVVAGATFGAIALVRYNSNGTLDTSFGSNGIVINSDAGQSAVDIKIQSDNKIVIGGGYEYEMLSKATIVRFVPNGQLDVTFNGKGYVWDGFRTQGENEGIATSIALQSDGKILLAGFLATPNFNNDIPHGFALARYHKNGTLDTSFNPQGTNSGVPGIVLTPFKGSNPIIHNAGQANAIALQKDGKILLAGSSGDGIMALACYHKNGTLDTAFNPSGVPPGTVITSFFNSTKDGVSTANSIIVQGDGKIVAAGNAFLALTIPESFAIARYIGTNDTAIED